MPDAFDATQQKIAPWLVTVAARSGAGASARGWIWGARLEAEAKKALSSWLLEMQLAETAHWAPPWGVDPSEGFRRQAERAWSEKTFDAALGWARPAIWRMARTMNPASGRYPMSFADPLSGAGNSASPDCVELGFYGMLAGPTDDASVRKFMLSLFRPMAERLKTAGPPAMKDTFWLPRLMPIDAPVNALMLSSIEREEILGAMRKSSLDSADKAAGDSRAQKKPPARRL